jgi:hypothetical protein
MNVSLPNKLNGFTGGEEVFPNVEETFVIEVEFSNGFVVSDMQMMTYDGIDDCCWDVDKDVTGL